jgi:cell wall-associated NlpC family hydrolase
MQKLQCDVYAANMMSEPSHKSELFTQFLYGDDALFLNEIVGHWIKVKHNWNGYEGWVLREQFIEIEKTNNAFITQSSNGYIIKNDKPYLIPVASFLEDELYFNQKCKVGSLVFNETEILKVLTSYLHVPYSWGMLTHAGIDCSGLSQILYRYFNIALPHLASQQMLLGTKVNTIENVQCGDLVFFKNKQEHIDHVGILLSANTIIHATENVGKVVIDSFTEQGIVSRKHQKLTHHLADLRRYL